VQGTASADPLSPLLFLQARGQASHSRDRGKWQVDCLEAAGESLIATAVDVHTSIDPGLILCAVHHAPRWFRRCGARSLRRDHVGVPRPLPYCLCLLITFVNSYSFSNTVQSMQLVLEFIPFLSLSVAEQHEGAKVLVEEMDPDERIISDELLDAFLQLRDDPAVLAVLGKCRGVLKTIAELTVFLSGRLTDCKARWQLNDSAPYFFFEVARTLPEDYKPTDQDIIRSRIRTTGVSRSRAFLDLLPETHCLYSLLQIVETSFMVGRQRYRIFVSLYPARLSTRR
jgi:hypothetical protein